MNSKWEDKMQLSRAKIVTNSKISILKLILSYNKLKLWPIFADIIVKKENFSI